MVMSSLTPQTEIGPSRDSDVANRAESLASESAARLKQARMMSAQAAASKGANEAIIGLVVVNQLNDSIPFDDEKVLHRAAKAALGLAPTFFLKQENGGRGLLGNPPVVAAGLVALTFGLQELIRREG